MNQKGFINIFVIALVVVVIGVGGYFVLQQKRTQQLQESLSEQPQQTEIAKPTQETPSDIPFSVLYPPTPFSFGCGPHAGAYTTQQGKVLKTYDQWKDLYGELLKGCYTKTDAPQLIDFDKQTMIAVFAGGSCTATKIDVKTISLDSNKIVVHSAVTVSGCALPSVSYPFALVAIDKTSLPIEFTFESAKHPNEPF